MHHQFSFYIQLCLFEKYLLSSYCIVNTGIDYLQVLCSPLCIGTPNFSELSFSYRGYFPMLLFVLYSNILTSRYYSFNITIYMIIPLLWNMKFLSKFSVL